jgi:hypothetical protein
MARAKRPGMTRETADVLAFVRVAIEDGKLSIDPTAAIVLADVEEEVRRYAHLAALVKVRAWNKGTPPSERARRERAEARRKLRRTAKGQYLVANEWSAYEMDLLAELARDRSLSIESIAETISERTGTIRSRWAVESKIYRLGLRADGKMRAHRDSPFLGRLRERREQRMAEARAEREGAMEGVA